MMETRLDRTSRRILGVLAEKAMTTPNLYPLTLNAVLNGCNQKSARNPTMHLRDFEVDGCLRSLQISGWVSRVEGQGSRVAKWKHRLGERLDLETAPLAVFAELLLRGDQKEGELRSNAQRMARIPDLETLRGLLEGLEAKGLVQQRPPRAGERARRWDHTLYTNEETTDRPTPSGPIPAEPPPPTSGANIEERLQALEHRVAELEERLGRSEGRALDE